MDAEHVHLERLPPGVGIDLPCRAVRAADARVCAQEVERPQLALGFSNRTLDRSPVGDVQLERQSADLGHDLLDLAARACTHGDSGARVRELARDPRADPAPAAGDERYLAGEIVSRDGVRIVGDSRRSTATRPDASRSRLGQG